MKKYKIYLTEGNNVDNLEMDTELLKKIRSCIDAKSTVALENKDGSVKAILNTTHIIMIAEV
jgi:hypothetical protein